MAKCWQLVPEVFNYAEMIKDSDKKYAGTCITTLATNHRKNSIQDRRPDRHASALLGGDRRVQTTMDIQFSSGHGL